MRIDIDLDYWRGWRIDVLHELLEYRPDTGDLVWRPRALKWFATERDWKRWNTRYAGKLAGNINKSHGYRMIDIFRVKHRAHRVIFAMMTGEWLLGKREDELIDHIDQDKLNNRWNNLRAATNQENLKNQTRYANNTSGITGVFWNKRHGKWYAHIRVDGRGIHLGNFTTLEAAIAARRAAERQYGYHENHGREKPMAA